jgi:hypothetical protein
MDSDGDGRISRSEAAADTTLTRGFSGADSNGDGYLSNSEYRNRSRSNSDSMKQPSGSSTETPRQ